MNGHSKAATHEEYIAEVDSAKRDDLLMLHGLISRCAPSLEKFMISGIMGFGKYHYRYASGREGDWFHLGLVANKTGFSVYVCAADANGYLPEQARLRLGKATVGKSCIRFKKLSDLNLVALEELLLRAAKICE